MEQRARLLLVLFVIIGLLALPFIGQPVFAQEDTGNGAAPEAAPDPLSLNLTVDPPVGAPGTLFRVTAAISNNTDETIAPEIILAFPPQMLVDPAQLPAGTTLNFGANQVDWYPVLAPAGLNQIQFEFQLTAADFTHPSQAILASVTHNGLTRQYQADYWLGVMPSATISLNPATVSVGQPVQLNAAVVGPGPIVQTWQLGDGRVIEVNNPTVVYPASGTYTVTLRVANPLGATEVTGLVTVGPETVAGFSITDDTVAAGEPVVFHNLSGGEAPLTYLWDFGDGQTSSEANPTHVYNITGNLLVTLQTENAFGSSVASGMIFVGRAPTADMVLLAPASANIPAQFQAFGDESVTEYAWEMGDGTQLSGESISHTYRASGEFAVTLHASNAYGTTSVTQLVSVAPGIWTVYIPVIRTPGTSGQPTQPTEVAPEQPLTDAGPGASIPEQLFWYVNEARRLHGLPPVSYNYELTIAAQQHTDDMAIHGYTGHTGVDGSSPADRLQRFGYTGAYAGEATAWGYDSPVPVVEFWVNSPSHRGMILNPAANEIGLGYTYNPNAPNIWYWTVEFGTRNDNAAAPAASELLVALRPALLPANRPEMA
ncbi:MAG: PKD domain-containing protein [Ardenticatenales bacterium]|nr:PKD domain-containing protein [Ardenticatenales bacterium]